MSFPVTLYPCKDSQELYGSSTLNREVWQETSSPGVPLLFSETYSFLTKPKIGRGKWTHIWLIFFFYLFFQNPLLMLSWARNIRDFLLLILHISLWLHHAGHLIYLVKGNSVHQERSLCPIQYMEIHCLSEI